MAAEPSWSHVGSPPGGEVRGLGMLDGAIVARTSDGLFAVTQEWPPLSATMTRLPSGRLVLAPAGTVALGIAPDGARWVGVRRDELTFYATPGPHGMDMLQPANLVHEHVERDGVVVRPGMAARDFAFDARGRVWVAGPSAVEVLEDGAWRVALKQPATAVEIGGDGEIIVGGPTAGWWSRDGERFVEVLGRATEEGGWGSLDLDAGNVQQIERAPDGAVYARIFDGVLVWREDRWVSRNLGLAVVPRRGSRNVRVTAMAMDATHVYAGTASHGVFRRKL